MFKYRYVGVVISVVIAIGTILVKGNLWYLGNLYWQLLWLLALTHIVVSSIIFLTKPSSLAIKLIVLAVLIVGQWWVIEMVVMLAIWGIWGFAP